MRFNKPKGTGFYILSPKNKEYLHTVHGIPPIKIHNAVSKFINKLTIGGNFVDSKGVGLRVYDNVYEIPIKIADENGNDKRYSLYTSGLDGAVGGLFSRPSNNLTGEFIAKAIDLTTGQEKTSNSYRITPFIESKFTGGFMTLNNLPLDAETIAFAYDISGNYLGRSAGITLSSPSFARLTRSTTGSSLTSGYGIRAKNAASGHVDSDVAYIRIQIKVSQTSLLKDVTLNSGRTALPYEPYGATISDTLTVTPTSATLTRRCGVEDGEIVYAPETVTDVTDLQLFPFQKLFDGDNEIFVNTPVQPSEVEIEYYSEIALMVGEDGTVLTSEDGKAIGGLI